ncbi:hypothetical protein [Enterococcus xiangfangensis]|uniref:ABC transporter Uup C-terminal domain-containing protein n=1 Tax=Enterococcus xiangfangensis TaxID=1296537 RepID=A0ABU3F7X8_9ENTE|nr:hypothetical protein [Enterococcus xiangfangensis]MBM7712882.1 hypothetical protein [Enterococcus xiangfangensis]MDT2758182.1 hypothetical protein [Enterococcus xiangfangensis]NBK09143.1 hypothetical protein [Enterococcus asini]
MDERQYENNLELLGQLRDRLQRLEDMDYMTAYYKGYSTSGATLDEIKEEIQILQGQINELEMQLDDFEW